MNAAQQNILKVVKASCKSICGSYTTRYEHYAYGKEPRVIYLQANSQEELDSIFEELTLDIYEGRELKGCYRAER